MKARIQWLTLGDKNTSFFNTVAVNKRRKNKIMQLQKEDNTWITNESKIIKEMCSYLKSTYDSNVLEVSPTLDQHNIQPNNLTEDHHLGLITTPDEQEIKHALFSINPLKT